MSAPPAFGPPAAAPGETVRGEGSPVLSCTGLHKEFRPSGKRRSAEGVVAVESIDLRLERGRTVGLVGESGSGKSTTGRMLVRLLEPDRGGLRYDGRDITHASAGALRDVRHRLQMVFQDPSSSLNRRWTVERTLDEPLRLRGMAGRVERQARLDELLSLVGLAPAHRQRFPHELSGGQRQRVGIARVLALEPEVVVLDEPVSALDVSVQAQILNLLEHLAGFLGLSYVFISHDLSVVAHVADEVSVMYAGRVVEVGATREIMADPLHPYTQALLSAIPELARERRRSGKRIVLPREPGRRPAGGCPFRSRCWKATERCAVEEPVLLRTGSGRAVACHHAGG